MTFLALNVQKSYLIQEKSQLEYKEMVASNNYNYVTSKLSTLASDDNVDMESNAVKQLEHMQELYDSEKGSIESQLEVLNAQIESFQKAVSTNIKSECKLSISV